MRAGQLRHRITIQIPNATADTFGEEIPDWQDLATVWAAVMPLRGREFLESRQVQAEISHRIRIRNRTDLAPTMRILFGARVFELDSIVRPDERDIYLDLICYEEIKN